jgi:SAM-dependent methyltransferase
MKFLNSKISFFFYLILQNRFIQILSSKEELNKVKKINYNHNNFREDYNFDDYQAGKNWNSFKTEDDYRGYLKYFPSFNNKVKVLEIGPGSGYYSKYICENINTEHYSFYEINLNFKKKMLNELKLLKKNSFFEFRAINKNFLDLSVKNKYDFIFFISSFHHIPDRKAYFEKCFNSLNKGGKIYFFEPTHYIFRILSIIRKFFRIYKYYSKKDILEHCGTHAFLTISEYKYISKRYDNNYILENYWIVRSKKINCILKYVKINFLKYFIKKYFSSEMITVFQKI